MSEEILITEEEMKALLYKFNFRLIAFNKNAVLMETGLRFMSRLILGCKIGLPTAGVQTNDIITKHVHTRQFGFSIVCSLIIMILDCANQRGLFRWDAKWHAFVT